MLPFLNQWWVQTLALQGQSPSCTLQKGLSSVGIATSAQSSPLPTCGEIAALPRPLPTERKSERLLLC